MELKSTALLNQHIQLGAKMVPFAGFNMPVQYQSLKEEIQSVRNKVGVFDVSHMGEFIVQGPQSVDFVNFLVTNEIHTAQTGKAIYTPLCRENGTIIDDLIVYKLRNDKIFICVNAANIEKDWQHFLSWSRNYDCMLSNISDDFSLIAIQGPKTIDILRKLNFSSKDIQIEYYSVTETFYKNTPIILARTGYTGEDGFEIFCSHDTAKSLWDDFLKEGVTPCGLGARDVLRLEVGYPLYGNELNDKLTPLDCGLKWTIKFDKNSFLGKEFLINYKPTTQLVKLSLDLAYGIPRAGYNIENENGEIIGNLSSGTMSPTLNRGIAMGHVYKEKYPKDQKFFINIRNNKAQAAFHQAPFLKGGHK